MGGEATKKASRFKPVYAVIIAVVVIVAAATAYYFTAGNASAAVVAAGDNVSVYYTGTFTNGTVFSTNAGGQLLNFTVGSGEVIRGFDQGVIGMRAGQNKTITVPPSEGYGEVNQSLIVSVPIFYFSNLTVYNGMVVTASNGQEATVVGYNATNVTVDFNPLLAGQTLMFDVEVVSIRK